MTEPDPGGAVRWSAPSPPAPAGAAPPYDALAIVAFVLAFTVPPGGIVCGVIARRRIRATGEQGDGLALAGLVLGSVFTGVIALFVLLWLGVMVSALLAFIAVVAQVPGGVAS